MPRKAKHCNYLIHMFKRLDYEEAGFIESDMVKLSIMINREPVDALSFIVHKSKAYTRAREVVDKLRQQISRQMFEVSIQAAIGNKVIASERYIFNKMIILTILA